MDAIGNQVLSVSDFLGIVNQLLAPVKVSVQGEITSIKVQGNNVYCTISDKSTQNKLDCYIYKRILDNRGIELAVGTEVVFKGYGKIYEPMGRFTFQVSDAGLVGEGELKKAFERLYKKLEEEGLFSESIKRPVPRFIQNIGLVTSQNGAAIKDFLTHLLPFGFKIYLVDTRVEGMSSSESIVKSIRTLNESTLLLDVIVVTRGGGSPESLQAFNAEEVARVIRSSRVPVISAVGHEQDFTISDYVSDHRASTPTDAAKQISSDWSKALQFVEACENSIFSNFRKSIGSSKITIDHLTSSIIHLLEVNIRKNSNEIEQGSREAIRYLNKIVTFTDALDASYAQNERLYLASMHSLTREFDNLKESISSMAESSIIRANKSINLLEESIKFNSPENKLKQGYSILRDNSGKVVKSIHKVKSGDEVTVMLLDGSLTTEVKNKNDKTN